MLELLRLVQLAGFENRLPAQLSGGQRQRIALARALAIEPRILLLDEPFGALDAMVRKELRSWVKQLQRQLKITTLFVTHDQDEALEIADRVVVMNTGRIEQIGTPGEVCEEPATPFRLGVSARTRGWSGVQELPEFRSCRIRTADFAFLSLTFQPQFLPPCHLRDDGVTRFSGRELDFPRLFFVDLNSPSLLTPALRRSITPESLHHSIFQNLRQKLSGYL